MFAAGSPDPTCGTYLHNDGLKSGLGGSGRDGDEGGGSLHCVFLKSNKQESVGDRNRATDEELAGRKLFNAVVDELEC